MLDAHDPYPGVAIDRSWNVVMANQAALLLVRDLPDSLVGPPRNVYRVCLHPHGLARHTVNFPEWAAYLLAQLRRSAAVTGDAGLRALAAEVGGYSNLAELGDSAPPMDEQRDEPDLLIPLRLQRDGIELSLFTTLTTFCTPLDVTLEEVVVELFFPADEPTAAHLAARRAESRRR